MTERVVLAVDGGPASAAALAWIVERARAVTCELEITTVMEVAWDADGFVDYRGAFQLLLDDAANEVRASHPDLVVTTMLRSGNPARALIAASREADLLIIGTNRTGPVSGIIHGTLPLRVAGRARCATVVVPATWQPGHVGVVVGWVDDGTADGAIEFAAQEATRLGQELTILHAWHVPPVLGLDGAASAQIFTDLEAAARDALASIADETRRAHPGLTVTEHLSGASAPVAIVSEAHGAALVVVGAHGRGALGGLILGSVSHDVLMNMPAPVVVVPHPDDPIEVLPEILDEDLI